MGSPNISKLLAASCVAMLWTVAAPHAQAVDDVTVRLNGGANVAYIGHTNTLEILLRNDASFWGIETPFRISIGRPFWFNPGFGNQGYVHVPSDRLTEFGGLVTVTAKFDNISPDTVSIASGGMILTVPAHGSPVLCYTLEFRIDSTATPLAGGICIDNIYYNVSGTIANWGICRSGPGCAPPLYQGNVNMSMNDPTAPPVCFDIVSGSPPPFGGNGDVNCDGKRTSSDIITLVNYVFKGGTAPCAVPQN